VKEIKLMKKIIYQYIIIVLSIGLAACAGKEQQEVADSRVDENSSTVFLSDAQINTAGIAFGKIEQKQISGTIKSNGVLDVPPQQLVTISAPLGGFVKSTDLLQGSRVKKGQRIAVIENPAYIQLQQEYLEAKNELEVAKADYDRQVSLSHENVNAGKTLLQAKSVYLRWLAKKNAAEAKLSMINVDMASLDQGNISGTASLYSPINGYVTEVNVNIGKFVNPSDVLFEIVDTEQLHAELTVFEKDIPKLKIGQKVRFTLANETKERMATVYLIGRQITSDRSIRIHCHIDQEDKELLPGMYLKANVEAGGLSVPVLPDEAIIGYQGAKYIFIQTSDQKSSQAKPQAQGKYFEMIPIVTGDSELGFTGITLPENVNEQTPIVVKGAYAIMAMMKNTEEE
jgi:cobalt-zinc-cadmium efflux system membrane fusion protein